MDTSMEASAHITKRYWEQSTLKTHKNATSLNALGVALKSYMTELLKQSIFYILKVIITNKSNLAALAVVKYSHLL